MSTITPELRRKIAGAWSVFCRDLRLSGHFVPTSQERSLLNFAVSSDDPAQALIDASARISRRALRVRPSRLPARLPPNYSKLAARWQECLQSAKACGMLIGTVEADAHFTAALSSDDPMMALLDVADAWCRLGTRPPVPNRACRSPGYADLLRRIQMKPEARKRNAR